MGLRRARELVVLMVKEFPPYGATPRISGRLTSPRKGNGLLVAVNAVSPTTSIPMDVGEQRWVQHIGLRTLLNPIFILRLGPADRMWTRLGP